MEKINSLELRKGTWTQEEDNLLRSCVLKHGEGKWNLVPQRAGLKRCRKSCRTRRFNYLKPNINRGNFTEDEVAMIRRFHKLLGNRWSMIAERLPGRTANDVKNLWQSKMRNKTEEDQRKKKAKEVKVRGHEIIKPRPYIFSENSPWLRNIKKPVSACENGGASASTSTCGSFAAQPCAPTDFSKSDADEWWDSLLEKKGDEGQIWNSMMEFFDQDFLHMEGLHTLWDTPFMKL